MDHNRPSTALFDVYLRLRPSTADRERFLDVEQLEQGYGPTHITIRPPVGDNRKRAVEKFAFTRVFEEDAGQRELFESTGTVQLIQGVLGESRREGRDGLVATLGVTGSGKVRAYYRVEDMIEVLMRSCTEPHYSRIKIAKRHNSAFSRLALPARRAALSRHRHKLDGFPITLLSRRIRRAAVSSCELARLHILRSIWAIKRSYSSQRRDACSWHNTSTRRNARICT